MDEPGKIADCVWLLRGMALALISRMPSLRAIFVRHKLRACSAVGEGTRAQGFVWVHGGGSVRLGARVHLDALTAPIELHAAPSAEIVLGDDVYIGGGASIEAEHSIRIGARCRIGAFSKIIDTHYHRLEGNRHQRPSAGSVVVEDDVELGPKTVLLPRAHIGHGTMVRAGTVVTRRFPPETILAGIPAAVRGRTSAIDVSVVIASSGRPALADAVSSVLSQQDVRVEVHVVDGSADGSAGRIIDGIGDRCVTHVGQGDVLAWARAPFVHFLADDHVVLPGAYRALIDALTPHPRRSMSFGRVVPRGDDLVAFFARVFRGVVSVDSACLVRKRSLEQAGGLGAGALPTVRTSGCVFVDRDVVQFRSVL